jgi:hypothetical protein
VHLAALPLHFMRNALAHAGKSGRPQDDAEAARAQWA